MLADGFKYFISVATSKQHFNNFTILWETNILINADFHKYVYQRPIIAAFIACPLNESKILK